MEKFGEWMRCSPLKKSFGRKFQVPAVAPRAVCALNFSGQQLLKAQAASSATSQGSKRKDREVYQEVPGRADNPMYTPKKLPQEVSNALAASVQQLGMHGAVVVQSEPAAGLDSYAGSSEFNTPSMTDNTDDDRKALNLQDKLLLAKQAKLKQKQEKKPGLRGTSPVKEIGKTKKASKGLKVNIIESVHELQTENNQFGALYRSATGVSVFTAKPAQGYP